MTKLEDGLILYHGSYCEVKDPDISKCAAEKDFGQGFYLTSSKKQAENFVKISINKAITTGKITISQTYGYISVFELDLSNNLRTYFFEKANIHWLHCVTAHRRKQLFAEVAQEMSKCDIIVGKITNDATNSILTAYIGGAYGSPGSKEADEICIRLLLPNKLKDQYCFKTQKAIECLKFVKGEKIWLQ